MPHDCKYFTAWTKAIFEASPVKANMDSPKNTWPICNVVIKEGRNREVRRIFESLDLTVSRLVRVGFGPIGLPNRLKRGQFYELNPAEVANIVKWADMPLPGERRRK